MLALSRLLLLLAAIVSAQDVQRLRRTLAKGGVKALFANDTGYAEASIVSNKRYTAFKPIVVTYPTSAEQVSTVVKAGAVQGLQVNARSGGHGYAANDLGGRDGAVLVDTSHMTRVIYNPKTKRAVIETGIKLGDLALALNEYGRAIPHGRCTHVGLGGHAGHGGFGYISRMWGLTLDVIHSATVVLADGTVKVASGNSNSDLFWALRGAASSFSVITSIEVNTRAIGDMQVTAFTYSWIPLTYIQAAEALIAFQTFTSRDELPIEFGGELHFFKGPTEGTIITQFSGGVFGRTEEFANATIQPFLDTFNSPANQIVQSTGNWIEGQKAISYGALNTSTEHNAWKDAAFYIKSMLTPEDAPMSNDSIHAVMEFMGVEAYPSDTLYALEVELWGGKGSLINKDPRKQTSFGHRNTHFGMQLQAGGSPPFNNDGFGVLDGITSKIVSNNKPNWEFGSYMNYIDDRLVNWQDQYFGSQYSRLQRLKARLDPQNTFRGPLAIEI